MTQQFDLDFQLTLVELCRACQVREEEVRAWVIEGVLEPSGDRPEEWRFTGPSLLRARRASRLSRDLDLNVAGIALAMVLLDEINALQANLEGIRPAYDPPPSVRSG
jgi:chaperone modulatory protein CbpM